MKSVSVLAGLLLTVLPVLGKKYEKSEGVYVLTDKNYEAAVAEFDFLLVYFYAPW